MSSDATFETALRMIDLALLLDQRRTDWAVKDAAAHLEVHPKTIRRYVDALATRLIDDAGKPLLGIRYQGKSPYITLRGPLLSVTPEIYDYASLFLATRLLDFAPKGQLRDGLSRLSEGLKSAIPANRHAVIARFAKKFSVFHAGIHRPADGELIGEILSGLVNERRLAIRYKNWPKAKTVEPLTLAVYREGLYLIVRMPGKPNPFMLAVPLIKSVEYLSKEKFTPPDDFSPETFRGANFGLLPGATSDVVLRFDAALEDYLSSRVFHPSQKLTKTQGGVRLTMRVSDSPELLAWVRGFGEAVVVEKPAGLREKLRASLKATAAKYTTSRGS